jgi:hypothetical protein
VRTSAPQADPFVPLTLSEQLDAMLTGWLERRTAGRRPALADTTGTVVVNIAEAHVPEFERFCAGWRLAVHHVGRGRRWVVLLVDGPALAVEGLAAITGMYRRG